MPKRKSSSGVVLSGSDPADIVIPDGLAFDPKPKKPKRDPATVKSEKQKEEEVKTEAARQRNLQIMTERAAWNELKNGPKPSKASKYFISSSRNIVAIDETCLVVGNGKRLLLAELVKNNEMEHVEQLIELGLIDSSFRNLLCRDEMEALRQNLQPVVIGTCPQESLPECGLELKGTVKDLNFDPSTGSMKKTKKEPAEEDEEEKDEEDGEEEETDPIDDSGEECNMVDMENNYVTDKPFKIDQEALEVVQLFGPDGKKVVGMETEEDGERKVYGCVVQHSVSELLGRHVCNLVARSGCRDVTAKYILGVPHDPVTGKMDKPADIKNEERMMQIYHIYRMVDMFDNIALVFPRPVEPAIAKDGKVFPYCSDSDSPNEYVVPSGSVTWSSKTGDLKPKTGVQPVDTTGDLAPQHVIMMTVQPDSEGPGEFETPKYDAHHLWPLPTDQFGRVGELAKKHGVGQYFPHLIQEDSVRGARKLDVFRISDDMRRNALDMPLAVRDSKTKKMVPTWEEACTARGKAFTDAERQAILALPFGNAWVENVDARTGKTVLRPINGQHDFESNVSPLKISNEGGKPEIFNGVSTKYEEVLDGAVLSTVGKHGKGFEKAIGKVPNDETISKKEEEEILASNRSLIVENQQLKEEKKEIKKLLEAANKKLDRVKANKAKNQHWLSAGGVAFLNQEGSYVVVADEGMDLIVDQGDNGMVKIEASSFRVVASKKVAQEIKMLMPPDDEDYEMAD